MTGLRWVLPLLLAVTGVASAADLAAPAQTLRARLADAQVELILDPGHAVTLAREAQATFGRDLAPELGKVDPGAARQVAADLNAAVRAAGQDDEPGFAAARTRAWTGLLGGTYRALESAVRKNDVAEARRWLPLREYRPANRFTHLNADATEAVEALARGQAGVDAALLGVRADLLDGYQTRLKDALTGLRDAQTQGYRIRAAEQTALARGYFEILAPAYREQRGEKALESARRAFAALPGSLKEVTGLMNGFRAAPLSERERARRASQALRYLRLVPVEYGRGVTGNAGQVVVKRDLEITEARTFLTAAGGAFDDLAPLLGDRAGTDAARGAFAMLAADLDRAARKENAPSAAQVQQGVDALSAQLSALFPAAWKRHDASGDIDVIRSQVAAAVRAAGAGNYDLAESGRLDAYATLEGGPEARIAVFAPDLKLRLEDLFWNGEEPKGLARLIREHGDAKAFGQTQAALESALNDTAKLLGTDVAPAAVATNAGVIVFREGLEAVLILAALMGSLRRENVRHLRRPMWLGAALALGASVLTWLVMQGTLGLFARFGEKLSAVVSVVAIGVLLVIMNWFFHNVYWTDRMAAFQQQKHQLMGGRVKGQSAQVLGLVVLGFTSIYREGFETVLFLQSLVLQSGTGVVLAGTGLGLAAVLGVGVLVFALQAKLPMKKLLVWTGGMICAVLFVMVGNTVHTLQLVGWLPVHALPVSLPAWAGLWGGLYATWEGVVLQVFAVVAVMGSYFLAEGLKERQLHRKLTAAASR
ncbi:iron permease (plasmid) [Deinococcus aetherius]|uniref:Iron permease n=1 Tax=Deinococcus aetherius TaxID=200252 RepID=A0ABM8ALG8_9DEIO|nr:FTR1 family protein [Deinococcus aetherius]BDP44658.1 iron permease [Deinococcus aetherius]